MSDTPPPSASERENARRGERRRRLGRKPRRMPEAPLDHWVRVRIYIVGGLVTLAMAGIAFKAHGLQLDDQEHYRELAARQHRRLVEIPAPRGNIYDATGKELAVNADVDSVVANPRQVVDVAQTALALSKALDLDVRELESKLASSRHFVWIERHVTPAEASAVRDLELTGIWLEPEPRRFYPGKTLAGTILGFAGIDGHGLDGIELTMDDLLAGQAGQMAALRDAAGRLMVADPNARAKPGASIKLTLSRPIQFAAERALEEALAINQAKSGVAVVMDVRTGDVLAMASWPRIDPNQPDRAVAAGARNRALTDVYEVGSVMKVFTVAAALEAGVVTPGTRINTEGGRFRIGRKRYEDSFHDEELDIGGVLKRSSNVGAIKIGQRLGATALHKMLVALGFSKLTGIELPGEQMGVLRDASLWGELGLASHSFGYGMSSTPLQVTAAMAAIGNGGVYHEPRLVKEVRDPDGKILFERKSEGRRVLSEKTAKDLWPMLESVFETGKEHGTAHRIRVPGYRVGGKTGTAHKLDPTTGTYGEDLYLSSFSGLAPIDDPRIAVTVLIDEPHGENYYGALVAGPAWARITAEALPILGIPADDSLVASEDTNRLERPNDDAELERDGAEGVAVPQLVMPVRDVDTNMAMPWLAEQEGSLVRVPDFTGVGLGRALQMAKNAGIELEARGTGRGIDQSPPPGLVAGPVRVQVTFTPSDYALPDR